MDVALHGGRGKRVRTLALLDTGAYMTLFSTEFADALGLDWKAAPTCPIAGISGTVQGHVLSVGVELIDTRYSWKPEIAFVPKLPIPLLGHHGFFEHFEVRFKTSIRWFRIHLK